MESSADSKHKIVDCHLIIIYGCFCLSGFTALIYELAWQRLLLRVLGSTLPAVTIVLCVFMGGLTAGCFIAGKISHRTVRPLLWYGILEILVALAAVLSLFVFDAQPGGLVSAYDGLATRMFGLANIDSFDPFNKLFWSRTSFVTTFLLVPTCLMGATFPLVSRYLERAAPGPAAQGRAYLANLVGAAFGTVCAGFCFLPLLGLSNTVLLACCLSSLIGLVLSVLSQGKHVQKLPGSTTVPTSPSANPSLVALVSTVVLINGAVGMSLEVVWSRLFSLLVGSSTYSVASVLAVSIFGLVLGTIIFQSFASKIQNYKLALGVLCGVIALCLCLDLWLIQLLPWLFNLNHEILSKSNSYFTYLIERIIVISLVVTPAALSCGGIFPLSMQALSNAHSNPLGRLYTCSSLGSVLGAALTGFIFVPLLGRIFVSGMESTICLIVLCEIALSAILLICASGELIGRISAVTPLFLCLALLVKPAWNQALMSSGIPFLSLPTKAATTKEVFDKVLSDSANNKLLFYREGLNTTVTVNANRLQNIVYLKNDGKVEAALPFNPQKFADTSDQATHFMLGKLPVSINPNQPKHVFVVGLGSGATCGGALTNASVKKLRIAEIEPTIFETEHFFEQSNGHPLLPEWTESGRVAPFCGDARMSLNFSNERYDAIISQPAEPWINGSADLYTLEFWKLANSKLSENGCLCQWIQLYAIDPQFLGVLCRTFQSVFPNTYVFHHPQAGEIILLGTRKVLGEQELASLTDLSLSPEALRARIKELSEKYQDRRLNTDDNLLTEYALPQRLYLSDRLIEENLRVLRIKN